MGIPAASGLTLATGTPVTNDRANAVLSGTITAIGPTLPFAFYGTINASLWGFAATPLVTTAGSSSASVTSGTGIAVGTAINSVNVPPGTTWATFSGTSGTLAFPPGVTNASVITGTDANSTFTDAALAFTGSTVQIERSFDGGKTWLCDNLGNSTTPTQALFASAKPILLRLSEVELGVLYRLNCTIFSGISIGYRLSQTGAGGMSWIPGSII